MGRGELFQARRAEYKKACDEGKHHLFEKEVSVGNAWELGSKCDKV
jgi:hypothetical protein